MNPPNAAPENIKQRRPARVLIAAGGSGGHIFPAIALGRALKDTRSGADILFVGSDKSLDRRIFEKEGSRHSLLSANKMPYRPSVQTAGFLFRLLVDMSRSFYLIAKFRPDVIVGFGGYVSFPVMAAAYLMRVPGIAHEQNAVPGRANKAIFALADRVALSFEETRSRMGRRAAKAIFTGNPIRPEIAGRDRDAGIRRFGLDPAKFTVLVIGGSQGAHFLNRTFVESLALMDARDAGRLQVIHITGVKDYEWALKSYEGAGVDGRAHSFVDRIDEAYAAADLVITRSGSSALFELAHLGKAMILVPYPFAMSHQSQNAQFFSRNSAALTLEEKSLTAAAFSEAVTALMRDRARLEALGAAAKKLSAPGASKALAEAALGLIRPEG